MCFHLLANYDRIILYCAAYVYETQYYSSTNCTRSSSAYGQSDYKIPVGVCNPVMSPNAPYEDDSVAYTEFVGLAFVADNSPSQEPSARPSARPSPAPTTVPTVNDLVLFAAQQVGGVLSSSVFYPV